MGQNAFKRVLEGFGVDFQKPGVLLLVGKQDISREYLKSDSLNAKNPNTPHVRVFLFHLFVQRRRGVVRFIRL